MNFLKSSKKRRAQSKSRQAYPFYLYMLKSSLKLFRQYESVFIRVVNLQAVDRSRSKLKLGFIFSLKQFNTINLTINDNRNCSWTFLMLFFTFNGVFTPRVSNVCLLAQNPSNIFFIHVCSFYLFLHWCRLMVLILLAYFRPHCSTNRRTDYTLLCYRFLSYL